MPNSPYRRILLAIVPALFLHPQPADAQIQPGFERLGIGVGLSGFGEELAVYDDGGGPALYVTGLFTIVSGEESRHIVKWDGRAWSPLDQGLATPTTPAARGRSLAVHDDGSGPK
ncbi:MAG: hypothetical protein AAGF23_22865, partial [Acidobacteriota bacterium]